MGNGERKVRAEGRGPGLGARKALVLREGGEKPERAARGRKGTETRRDLSARAPAAVPIRPRPPHDPCLAVIAPAPRSHVPTARFCAGPELGI